MTDNVVQYKKRSLVRIEPITKDIDEALNKSLPLLKTSIEAYGRNVDPEEVIEDILDQSSLLWHVYLEDTLIAAFTTYSLFYLKGVAPPAITIRIIYRGIIPFVGLQLFGLALMIIWPGLVLWIPEAVFGN